MRARSTVVVVVLFAASGCLASGGNAPVDRMPPPTRGRSDGGTRADAGRPAPPPTGCAGGTATTVSGVVRFPNGTLPVSNAFVYVPTGSVDDVARSGECGECVDGASVSAHTTTGSDGRFELTGLTGGARQIVIEKGKFRRVANVEITECTRNELDAELIRLPRDSSEGQVPHVAVVQGEYDRMEVVLQQIGLAPSAVDLIASPIYGDASSDQASALLRDRARLTSYDIVLVNCGAWVTDYDGVALCSDATVRDNLRAFVQGGGRLYATDLSYEIVEVTNPEMADFYGGTGDGMSSTVERPFGDAEIGDPMDSVVATVHDEDLRAWLEVNGALSGHDTMTVDGMLDGFTMMDRASPTHAKTWVDGAVEWGSYIGVSGRGVRPLTVSTELGCGRTLFTSYHTVEESWGGSGGLVGQELALAYLVLEIGSGVQDPVLY